MYRANNANTARVPSHTFNPRKQRTGNYTTRSPMSEVEILYTIRGSSWFINTDFVVYSPLAPPPFPLPLVEDYNVAFLPSALIARLWIYLDIAIIYPLICTKTNYTSVPMSNQPFSDSRRRHSGPGGFSSTGRRTALGYWLPLALTVGVAAVSLATWVWSERRDGEDDDDYYEDKEHHKRRDENVPGGFQPGAESSQPESGYAKATGAHDGAHPEDASVISRVQGALRRTPSPQQLFDGASRRVAAGVAAAGAVVGGALTAIREEGPNDFEDHSRWTEEANSRSVLATAGPRAMTGALPPPSVAPTAHAPKTKSRKTVAIVVSSVGFVEDQDDSEGQIPEHVGLLFKILVDAVGANPPLNSLSCPISLNTSNPILHEFSS